MVKIDPKHAELLWIGDFEDEEYERDLKAGLYSFSGKRPETKYVTVKCLRCNKKFSSPSKTKRLCKSCTMYVESRSALQVYGFAY